MLAQVPRKGLTLDLFDSHMIRRPKRQMVFYSGHSLGWVGITPGHVLKRGTFGAGGKILRSACLWTIGGMITGFQQRHRDIVFWEIDLRLSSLLC